MFEKQDEHDHSFWISYTDLVTGFMVIFLVVAFILLAENRDIKGQQIPNPEATLDSIGGEGDKVNAKYFELVDKFREKLKGIDNIQVTDEGTIRFFYGGENRYILFPDGDYHMTQSFQSLLDIFIPIYYEEIRDIYEQKGSKVQLKEIRIEGHTSSTSTYAFNLKLSNLRAYNVATHILSSEYYRGLDKGLQQFIRDNTIAVGYSFSRLLDKNGALILDSKEPEDEDKSRRVEFRLILEEKPNIDED